MAEMKKVTVRVDSGMQQRLAKKSRASGVPQAELIRRVLSKHFK